MDFEDIEIDLLHYNLNVFQPVRMAERAKAPDSSSKTCHHYSMTMQDGAFLKGFLLCKCGRGLESHS